jgi:beta-lactamase class D
MPKRWRLCLLLLALSGSLAAGPATVHPALRTLAERAPYPATLVVKAPGTAAPWVSALAPAQRRSVPASTFKIASTLAVLEAGLVADAGTVLPWDGVRRDREEINGPLPLREAFHRSALPHYQALVARLGPAAMAAFLARVGYGNAQSDDSVEFWLRGPLAISPLEQVALLESLSRSALAAEPRAQKKLWALMEKAPLGGRPWRGKTGWSRPLGGPDVGWFVGALEVPAGHCFVALRLEAEHPPADTFLPQREALAQAALARIPGCGG